LENEAVLDRMDARMARNPDIVRLVEHPFCSIKQWMNLSNAAITQGSAEFSLNALAYNLRRVPSIVESPT